MDNFYKKVELSKQKLQEAGILDKTVTIMESNKGSMAVMVGMGYGRGVSGYLSIFRNESTPDRATGNRKLQE